MATKRSRKGRKAAAKKSAGARHVIGGHKYGGRDFECYGKHVRAGRSNKKVARIFCAKKA